MQTTYVRLVAIFMRVIVLLVVVTFPLSSPNEDPRFSGGRCVSLSMVNCQRPSDSEHSSIAGVLVE